MLVDLTTCEEGAQDGAQPSPVPIATVALDLASPAAGPKRQVGLRLGPMDAETALQELGAQACLCAGGALPAGSCAEAL